MEPFVELHAGDAADEGNDDVDEGKGADADGDGRIEDAEGAVGRDDGSDDERSGGDDARGAVGNACMLDGGDAEREDHGADAFAERGQGSRIRHDQRGLTREAQQQKPREESAEQLYQHIREGVPEGHFANTEEADRNGGIQVCSADAADRIHEETQNDTRQHDGGDGERLDDGEADAEGKDEGAEEFGHMFADEEGGHAGGREETFASNLSS